MLEKLTFRTDYKTKKDMDSAIALGIGISFLFLLLSFAFFNINAVSYMFGLGAIIYQIYSLYIIKEAFKSKKMTPFKYIVVFAVVLFILTIFVLLSKFNKESIHGDLLQIFLSFLAIASPLLFWEKLLGKIKKKIILVFLLAVLINGTKAQNETISDKLDTIERGIGFFRSILNFFSEVTSFFGRISGWIQNTLGFSNSVSLVFNIILILFAVYLVTKTMKFMIKWAMIILLIWILLQVTGIL